jgi:hypothetical protein
VRVSGLIAAVDAAIARLEKGTVMSEEEMKEVFEGWNPQQHEAEAEARWGKTSEYQQSKQRTARYRKEDWVAIKAEAERIYRDLAALLARGVPPSDPAARDLAEAHRAHITRWFYDCSPEVHRGLGQLYVDDPRFTANIDKFGSGLAAYAREAFAANAERVRGKDEGEEGE